MRKLGAEAKTTVRKAILPCRNITDNARTGQRVTNIEILGIQRVVYNLVLRKEPGNEVG